MKKYEELVSVSVPLSELELVLRLASALMLVLVCNGWCFKEYLLCFMTANIDLLSKNNNCDRGKKRLK